MDLHTIWPFPFDDGWHLHPADEGMVFASSPCARLWTRFAAAPLRRSKGTWTIGANRVPFGARVWEISFDATTPAEVRHDVHAELLDLYLESRSSAPGRLFEDATAPHEVYAPLLARGWSHSIKTTGTQTFLAPEGLGSVQHQYATGSTGEPIWRAWGGYPSDPQWKAAFSYGAPATLAAAFTASLISTEPLQRAVKDVPFRTRRYLYLAAPAATKTPPHPLPALPPAVATTSRTPRPPTN